jgi:uncharacterized membrane protein
MNGAPVRRRGTVLLLAAVLLVRSSVVLPAEVGERTTEPSRAERLALWLKDHEVGNAAVVVIIAMLPIFELRGSIPVALGLFGMPVWKAYVLSVIGNMIPIVPIVLLIGPVSDFLMKRSRFWRRFFHWIFERSRRRGGDLVEKYEAVGLALFVCIPLPVTGAWTGSMLAFLMRIRARRAFPAILAGVTLAGVIVTLVVQGVLGAFDFFVAGRP